MNFERLNVRLRTDQREWLNFKANGRPLNSTLSELIDQAMKSNPLRIIVRHCTMFGDDFYAVGLGEYGDDFFESASRVDAVAAAQAKAKELGLPRSAIRFRVDRSDEAA